MKLYEESLNVLKVGLFLSVVSWGILLPAIGTASMTPFHTFLIVPAFFGLMFVLHGITNSGTPTDEERREEKLRSHVLPGGPGLRS